MHREHPSVNTANYCPEKQVLFFLIFHTGKPSHSQRAKASLRAVFRSCCQWDTCLVFLNLEMGQMFPAALQGARVKGAGAPGGKLVGHWGLMSSAVQAGNRTTLPLLAVDLWRQRKSALHGGDISGAQECPWGQMVADSTLPGGLGWCPRTPESCTWGGEAFLHFDLKNFSKLNGWKCVKVPSGVLLSPHCLFRIVFVPSCLSTSCSPRKFVHTQKEPSIDTGWQGAPAR